MKSLIRKMLYKLLLRLYKSEIAAFEATLASKASDHIAESMSNANNSDPGEEIELVSLMDEWDLEFEIKSRMRIRASGPDKMQLQINSLSLTGIDQHGAAYVNSASPESLSELAARLTNNMTRYIVKSGRLIIGGNRMQN